MELATFQYMEDSGWSVRQFPELDSENTLLLVFADPEFIQRPKVLYDMAKHYPTSLIVGCSSPKEILGSFVLGDTVSLVSVAEHKIVVSAIHFRHTTMKKFIFSMNKTSQNSQLGHEIVTYLAAPDLKGVLLLSESDESTFNTLLKGLHFKAPANPHLTCALASKGQNSQSSWVLIDGKIKKNTGVALGFYGDQFHMETNHLFDNQQLNDISILAISQRHQLENSVENEEYQLENQMNFLPPQTQLIGLYSAKGAKEIPITLLYEEEVDIESNDKKSDNILYGKSIAKSILSDVKNKALRLEQFTGHKPKLALVYSEHCPEVLIYVRSIKKAAEEAGIQLAYFSYTTKTDEQQLIQLIQALNHDKNIDGLQLMLPLPEYYNKNKIIEAISPDKDVDCIHPNNFGNIIQNQPQFLPCSAQAVMLMLRSIKKRFAGKHAVVIGSSHVGMPIAILLMKANCTVSICNIHTLNLAKHVRQADILVTAAGAMHLIKGEWIKKGALVIDVGISSTPQGKIFGDVEFESAKTKAKWITPVPGGIGPVTIAVLMQQTLNAARNHYLLRS